LLAVVFMLTVLGFVPVGQLCGRLMTKRDNLRAYGLNLLGSILGVGAVTVFSYFWTPPVLWFSLCFASLLFFQTFSNRALMAGVLSLLVGVIVLSWPVAPGYERLHTPYQLLERGAGQNGLAEIKAAGHFYQRVHDLSAANANRNFDQNLRGLAAYYELPYLIYGKAAQKIAIVGAGTGNDVAAALRYGVAQVDAIEIDPGILHLGRMYHPERPYDNPRVRAIVNDARTFLRTTDTVYDIIVYGLLDSHTLLSQASSVRLDSFVYTVEGLKEARQRLKPDGLLSLSFAVMSDEIGRKIYLMMKDAFEGTPPLCLRAHGFITFLQTRDGSLTLDGSTLKSNGFMDITSYYANPKLQADVPTDDWPFFYMPRRVYPVSYFGVFGLILAISVICTYNFTKQKPAFSSSAFFFLGAAFMLVETRAITELGLTFGNTWQVIGIVISAILLMAFLANCAVQWFRIRSPILWFLFLVASLLVGYLFSGQGGFGASISGKIDTVLLLTCPMFFSGIVFSTFLAHTEDVAGVMAVNILGAMIGGILEYNSMYFGFRFLYLLALMMYVLAFVSYYLTKRQFKAI
jgi:spermidine synthase